MKKGFVAMIAVCTVFLLTACASVTTKFVPKTKENVGVFADTTLTMLSGLDFGFNRNEAVYLREFFNPEGGEEKQLLTNNKALNEAFKNILKYSLQLVIIAETYEQESDRVAAYADYLAEADPAVAEERGLDKSYYVELVKKIRSQEKFLDALKTAQPIISAMTYYVNSKLDEKQAVIEALADIIEVRIDKEYAEVIRYQETLEEEKYAVLRSMEHLYNTYVGVPEAFNRLLADGAIRDNKLIPSGKPSNENLMKISDHLRTRLNAIHLIGQEIKPDWDDYRATHRELDTIYAEGMNRMNKVRLMTLVWLRAHQKMAAGVVSPAEWFNVQELPSQLIGMSVKTIF